MARYTGPVCRLCRREDMKLFLKGERCYTDKCGYERRAYPPGQHGQAAAASSRTTASSCARSRRSSASTASPSGSSAATTTRRSRMKGVTGENLLQLLERRLDNVVYRLGFARDHAEARQLVRHGHFTSTASRSTSRRSCARRATSIEVSEASQKIARIIEASAPSTAAACRSGSSSTRTTSRARSSSCRRARTSRCRSASSSSSSSTRSKSLSSLVPSASGSKTRTSIGLMKARRPRRRRHGTDPRADRLHREELARPDPAAEARGRGALTTTYGKFTCEPLERGFGTTLGNACAASCCRRCRARRSPHIKIEGALHEFTDAPRRRRGRDRHRPQPQGGAPQGRARQDLHDPPRQGGRGRGHRRRHHARRRRRAASTRTTSICTLSQGRQAAMELHVATGRGYVPAERNKTPTCRSA